MLQQATSLKSILLIEISTQLYYALKQIYLPQITLFGVDLEKIENSRNTYVVHSLKNKKEAAAYLQVALEEYQKDDDLEAFLLALRHVAEAQGGLGRLAKKTHLNRESLYKTLSSKGNPRLQTIGLLLKGLGFEFFIRTI
jgi:probable addiction module antidote protein